MIKFRLLPALVLTAVGFAAPVVAGSYAGGPVISRPGLPLDPVLLPPNSGPGDCVVRRVTGPGGAYRWDRVECDATRGWSGHDQWGYGPGRLEVETRDGRPPLLGGVEGDRYGGYSHAPRYERRVDHYEHQTVRAYDSGYVSGDLREDRYGPAPAHVELGYGGAAGRDRAGYLVWPGKLP